MSSMRNAVQRRVHRERGQLHERARLGLLEKHKDYSLRAADYKQKKATLRSLRAKAAARNEDEFYFGMLSRRGPGSSITAGGLPGATGKSSGAKSWSGTVSSRNNDRGDGVKELSVDVVRLMKTQDLGYVRTMRRVAGKELARIEERARLAGILEGGNEKIVFCDDGEERQEVMKRGEKVEEAEEKEDDSEGMDWEEDEEDEDATAQDEMAKAKERLRKQLEHARRKVKVLTEAELELDEQRVKMAKTATSGGYTKSGQKIVVRKRKR